MKFVVEVDTPWTADDAECVETGLTAREVLQSMLRSASGDDSFTVLSAKLPDMTTLAMKMVVMDMSQGHQDLNVTVHTTVPTVVGPWTADDAADVLMPVIAYSNEFEIASQEFYIDGVHQPRDLVLPASWGESD